MNTQRRFRGITILLIVAAVVLISQVAGNLRRAGDISYGEMRSCFVQEKVRSFTATDDRLTAVLQDDSTVTCALQSFDTFYSDLNDLVVEQSDKGIITSYNYTPSNSTNWLSTLLPYVLAVMAFILLMNLITRTGGGSAVNDKMARFGEARIQDIPDDGKKVTFKDVAGADEEKEELEEIVQFLRDPGKYTELGAHIPKGVLLVGPPGTGKTLLAKAVAGEADTAFLSISGSDFVEMYVGVGASRVRDLFEQAKKQSPAIVFIDEIDAVGRQRGSGLGGGHDEREQTLNQLLVEMDGFGANEGVIMIAATNRPDVLDSALLRPGRFDRKITVNYPDVKGREEILQVHARKKTFEPDVDLHKIAQLTPGCTGADLENILNEAAILAVRNGHNAISISDIDEGIKRVFYGPEKRSRVITAEDLKTTAYHEVGHAVVAHCLPHCDPVQELSVIPRGNAAGYTRVIPEDTYEHVSRGKLLDFIAMALAGRAAEALLLDDICTGATNDLQRATEIAHSIVTEYGMSDAIGPVYLAGEQEVFIGKSWGQQRNYSEDVASRVDTEVRRIMEEQSKRATQVLSEHREAVERVVNALIEREQLTGEEFVKVFNGETLTPVKPSACLSNASDNASDKQGNGSVKAYDDSAKSENTDARLKE